MANKPRKTNGVATRVKEAPSPAEVAEPPAVSDAMRIVDAALADVVDLEEQVQPVQVDELAAHVLNAAQGSMAGARAAVTGIAGAAIEVVLYCLPEDWRDDEARALLSKLTGDEQALLCAWLTRTFWDGYGAGQTHAKQGADLRTAAEGAPSGA